MGLPVRGAAVDADASVTGPLVVCSHLPGEGHFESDRFEVLAIECAGDFDYWQGLATVWGSDRILINVEHDMGVTDEHVAALAACRYGACGWAYRCNWISTGVPGGVIAAGRGVRSLDQSGDPKYLQGGEHWAAWAAIGLVKITPEARVGPLRREPWGLLELAVHDATERPWHMHWPIVNHWHF